MTCYAFGIDGGEGPKSEVAILNEMARLRAMPHPTLEDDQRYHDLRHARNRFLRKSRSVTPPQDP